METLLEYGRKTLQEIDELEQIAVQHLLQKPKTHRDQILQQTRVSKNIEQIMEKSSQLLKLNDDEDGFFKRDVDQIRDFDVFYDRLKSIKDTYRSLPNELAPVFDPKVFGLDHDAELEELECHFTGEETLGRHLDLHELYQEFMNIKGIERIPYLIYLDRIERFKDIPREIKRKSNYLTYLNRLLDYLKGWLKRSQPLFDRDSLIGPAEDEFDYFWSEGKVPFWELKEPEPVVADLYCLACDKTFTKESVFEAHKTGKKHLKGLEQLAKKGIKEEKVDKQTAMVEAVQQEHEKFKPVAKAEFLIQKIVSHLAQVREDTKAHVERKQALTEKERLDEEEEAPIQIEESDDDDDDKVYNPLKLPIGWDGKPIPFWLYKLHGLGIEYPCEICGGYVYMGRKAFDRHFQEYRHAQGMRSLGIPNGRFFQDITKIEDAYALAEKLKFNTKMASTAAEIVEEFEDDAGNVYNKRTYEGEH